MESPEEKGRKAKESAEKRQKDKQVREQGRVVKRTLRDAVDVKDK